MDPFTEKKIEIEKKKNALLNAYPKLWKKMLLEWSTPDVGARGWMLYSANYLFHTAGIRWAIDPIRLNWRIADSPQVDISPLANLDYILLTHRHSDHLDLELLKNLENYPITWIIPEFLLDLIRTAGIKPGKIIIPNPMVPISLDGITLTPFDGFHWEGSNSLESGQRGVPSTGYLIEYNGKRWLFPGDTRTFHPDALTCFGPVEISHCPFVVGTRLCITGNTCTIGSILSFLPFLTTQSYHRYSPGRNWPPTR